MNKARVRHFHVLTGRPLLGSFVRGTRDRLREIFGRLRALDGDSPAEDERTANVSSWWKGYIVWKHASNWARKLSQGT
jgi:hypothetical protein